MESGNQPFYFFSKIRSKMHCPKSQNKNCVPNTRDRNLAKKKKIPNSITKARVVVSQK